jgi:isopentenyl diphosphate isomerase/L-lactate dehydrogenase-like FMN-dependent dehydrogenase
MLVDVSVRSQEITLFGNKQSMPIVIAPTGAAGLLWHEGEVALARAAKAAGIPFTLATNSITPMEKVAEQAGGRLWFQLYMWADRSMSHQLIKRASSNGYEGLVVTVDSVIHPNREYNQHNGYTRPFTLNRKNVTDVLTHPRWLFNVFARYMMTTGMPRRENYPDALRKEIYKDISLIKNESLNWDDLKALRELWPGKLMVKGILHPKDAIRAADCGADGVIVSNHGGRNLDAARATIDVLPQVVDAVGNRVTVIVDSGFRRGSDVIKALSLGAKAVLIGRSTLYGIAVAGQFGAAHALDIFRDEIDRILVQIGCRDVNELTPEYVSLPQIPGQLESREFQTSYGEQGLRQVRAR